MADSVFDPLAANDQWRLPTPLVGQPQSAGDLLYEYGRTRDYLDTPDLSGRRPRVLLDEPADTKAVRFGSVSDPMQLDMDPFGRNTVEWGKVNGDEKSPDFVMSANVFGHVFSRDKLQTTPEGRELIKLIEERRQGRRRTFWDAITDWSATDLPFFGMFASVHHDIGAAIDVHDALGKIQDGKPLTAYEALKTRLYLAENDRKGTWGSVVGDIVRAAPGFMGEFIMSGRALGALRAGIAKTAEGSPRAAARLALDRSNKYTARALVEGEFATAFGKAGAPATGAKLREGWEGLQYARANGVVTGLNDSAAVVDGVKRRATDAFKPLVQAQLNCTDEVAGRVAAARIEIETSRAVARLHPSSAFRRWAKGAWQATWDHLSRGAMDFGMYETPVYSMMSEELGSAMKTLGHAIGALGPEAIVRGAMISLPRFGVVNPLMTLGYGRAPVTSHQLSLEAKAVQEGNRDLYDSAEAYAMGLNMMEYISESTGRGFGEAFRGIGLATLGSRAMGLSAGSSGLLPKAVAERAGSAMRSWISKVTGTDAQFLRGHLTDQVTAVSRKLGVNAPRTAVEKFMRTGDAAVLGDSAATVKAVETFVRTGDKGVLGAAASAVGDTPARKFVDQAVREMLKADKLNMSYRGFLRYYIADKMARWGWGPEKTVRWLRHAGYDGIVEEMLEERYSDFAKGLFGWDDRAAKDKGFGKNILQAFHNLNPGWEQLTAEAVGFAVPMGARIAVDMVHRAATDSDLSYVQRYASTMRELRGVNNIVEARAATHAKVARDERARLERERDDLQREFDALSAELDARNVTSEFRTQALAETQAKLEDAKRRFTVADDQVRKQSTVDGAAETNAGAILAYEAVNTTGEERKGDVPTAEQAHRGIVAKDIIVEGAAHAGEVLARARKAALDPRSMNLWQRTVHRVANVLGAIVTGDLSMAMADPMSWSMVDRGMDRGIVNRLADAYDAHYAEAEAQLLVETSESGNHRKPTEEEIRERMASGYETEARHIAQAWLAAQGVRMFSRDEMVEQARGIVSDTYPELDAPGREAERERVVDQIREAIAERTLRLLSGGAVHTADDMSEIANGLISVPDDSPYLDDVILDASHKLAGSQITDAALRQSGFLRLEEVIELRPDTDLRQAIGSRSIRAEELRRVLTIDSAGLDAMSEDDAKFMYDLAVRLRYRPNSDVTGDNTMAFTDAAIRRVNERLVRLARLLAASSSGYVRSYHKEADRAPVFGDGMRKASEDSIRVRMLSDGRYTWTEPGRNGEPVQKVAESEDALAEQMAERGYVRTDTPATFVLAREIRTTDPALMCVKLGLTSAYTSLASDDRAASEFLSADRMNVHPAFRKRFSQDGEPVPLTIDEYRRTFEDELHRALRFRDVMSMPSASQIAAYRETADESDETIRKRIAADEAVYKAVFGSEQEQNGYLPRLEKLLQARGVTLPGGRSYSKSLAGEPQYYTLNTRLMNYQEGEAFILVDIARGDVGYEGPLVSRAVTNGLLTFRDLWTKDSRTGKTGVYYTLVQSMVKRMSRVAVDLIDDSNNRKQHAEARQMKRLLDSLTMGSSMEADVPNIETLAWLARNVVFDVAQREAEAARSTVAGVAAAARLAEALKQTPEYLLFYGFIDRILGGYGFGQAVASQLVNEKSANVRGVARLAAALWGSPKDLVKHTISRMLPKTRSGDPMPVATFLDKVNSVLSARGVTPDATAKSNVEEAARSESAYALNKFVHSLMRMTGATTVHAFKEFMSEILQAAGVDAGNTAQLAGWKDAIQRNRAARAAASTEQVERLSKIDSLNEKVAELEAKGAESADQIQALKLQIDTLIRQNRGPGETDVTPGTNPKAQSDASYLESSPSAEQDSGESVEQDSGEGVDLTSSDIDSIIDEFKLNIEDDTGAASFDVEVNPDGTPRPPAEGGDTSREDGVDEAGNVVTTGDPVKVPDPVTLSDPARRHLIWTVAHAALARAFTDVDRALGGEGVPDRLRDRFHEYLDLLFPGLTPGDREEVERDLGGLRRLSDESGPDGQAADLDEVTEFMKLVNTLDEEGRFTKDYEGWNDKAVAAYNSLGPMVEMLNAAFPLGRRNFQGIVELLRDDIRRRLDTLSSLAESGETADAYTENLIRAYRDASRLLNPRSMPEGDNYAQRLAVHRAVVEELLGTDRKVISAMVRAFAAPVSLLGNRRVAENAPLAVFFSFLSSLNNAGTRQSIALLFSSSTVCSAVDVAPVAKIDQSDDLSQDATEDPDVRQSGNLRIRTSVTTRGVVSLDAVLSPFLSLADLNRTAMDAVVGYYHSLTSEPDGESQTRLAQRLRFQAYEMLAGKPDRAYGVVQQSPTQPLRIPHGMLQQDIETFRYNCEIVADVFDKVFGRGNSISRVLTSSSLFDSLRAAAANARTRSQVVILRTLLSMFSPVRGKTGLVERPYALAAIESLLKQVADDATTTSGVGQRRLSDIVQTLFATDNLEVANVAFPGADAERTSLWYALFNQFTQSMPDTVVPAKPVPGRTTKDSSVAVAAPGMIPMVIRFMTDKSREDSPVSFRNLCRSIIERDARTIYWRDLGGELGYYINPQNPKGDLVDALSRADPATLKSLAARGILDQKDVDDAFDVGRSAVDESDNSNEAWDERYLAAVDDLVPKIMARAEGFHEEIIASRGGIDAVVDECLGTMTWPDLAHTPIVARNISVDYAPHELGAACAYTFENQSGLWFVPLFGGDHACNNLMQIPAPKPTKANYIEACRMVNDAAGVTLMMADTKRSAMTSATAAAIPMAGAVVQWTDDEIPDIKGVEFGEARQHVMLNLEASEAGEEYSQEYLHGETVASGFGPDALRASSKDPKLRISKFHAMVTGTFIGFTKSADTIVSPDDYKDGGVAAPGTVERILRDRIISYRTDSDRRKSSDIATDEDSYKVGPLNSAIYQVATVDEPDADGHIPGIAILGFIKKGLREGRTPEEILSTPVRMVDRSRQDSNGKLSDRFVTDQPIRLGDALDGLEIESVGGYYGSGPKGESAKAFDISYRDNTMLALKVANIAHRAVPHLGTLGKNYTLDTLTKAMEQSLRAGKPLVVGPGSEGATPQSQAVSTLLGCAMVGAAVATDPVSVDYDLSSEERLLGLQKHKAHQYGIEYRDLRSRIIAKRMRKAMLAPFNKVDATLTSCGATRSKSGALLDHTLCPMHRDVHHGSIVLDSSETGQGGLYEGFKRFFADAEVNVQASWFRYGLFLDESLPGYKAAFKGCTTPAQIMERLEGLVGLVYKADREYDEATSNYKTALRAELLKRRGARKSRAQVYADAESAVRQVGIRAVYDSVKESRSRIREKLFSCFTDHHGTVVSEKFVEVPAKGGGTERVNYHLTVSVADLFVNDGKGGTRFDRTAFRMGDDGVRRAVYDEKGKLVEAKSSGDRKMMYLAGTTIGAPRTPSYNGAAWLQIVRASFPVRETYDDDTGMWSVGDDAVISLDPSTRDEILGADNDGDETSLFMITPNSSGYVPLADISRFLPSMDSSVAEGFALENDVLAPEVRADLLRKASEADPQTGVRFLRRVGDAKDAPYEFTAAGRRAVSNALVTALVDMAMYHEVPSGQGRRPYASNESGRTKAQPFDDARFWKPDPDRPDPSIPALIDVMPPDLIGKGDTIGDPKLQEAVSLSAKKSSKARALIVSAAAALHVAYLSGLFTSRKDANGSETNEFALFSDDSPDRWQAFIRHFDGLSNATFDDVKERICQRLGLVPEMIDVVVVDLLSANVTPTTDREWYDILAKYVRSYRFRDPSGKSEWGDSPKLDSGVDPSVDKSRMFMAGVADEYGSAWHKLADRVLFGNARGREARRDALMRTLGVKRSAFMTPSGTLAWTYVRDINLPERSIRRVVADWITSRRGMAASVIESALERNGHNVTAGYLLWLLSAGFGSPANAMVADAASGREPVIGDDAMANNLFAAHGEAFWRFYSRYRAWTTAKDFASAVNFAKADPGSDTAYRKLEKANKAYQEVMANGFNELARGTGRRQLLLYLHKAVQMAYHCDLVNAGTPGARAFAAVKTLQSNPKVNLDIIEDLLNKSTPGSETPDAQAAADAQAVLDVAGYASANDMLVSEFDRDDLRDSLRGTLYAVAALQSVPRDRLRYMASYDDMQRFMEALGDLPYTDPSPRKRILGFVYTVECMFRALYALHATSKEGLDHPGLLYFGMRRNTSFEYRAPSSEGGDYKGGNDGYGMRLGMELAQIMPMFISRDAYANKRMRDSVQKLCEGDLDGKTRTLRFHGMAEGAPTAIAKTFNLSKENLKNLKAELGGTNSRLSDAVDLLIAGWEKIAKAANSPADKFTITMGDFLSGILPLYAAVTTTVRATPSDSQFNGTLHAMLPGGYDLWSEQQGTNDQAYDQRRAMMRPVKGVPPVGFADMIAAVNLAPVSETATARRIRGLSDAMRIADQNKIFAAIDSVVDRSVAPDSPLVAVHPVRRNPEHRHFTDIFAYDGVLFKLARLYDYLKGERIYAPARPATPAQEAADSVDPAPADVKPDETAPQPAPVPGTRTKAELDAAMSSAMEKRLAALAGRQTAAQDAAPAEQGAGLRTMTGTDAVDLADETPADPTLVNLADSLRNHLRLTSGLQVEVRGSSLYISGQIQDGDSGKSAASTVIRVDLVPEGFSPKGADIYSMATATSVTNALRRAGVMDISPEDFLERLSPDERRMLMERYMPEALAKGPVGLSLRSPSWGIDGRGLLVLGGVIKLRKGDTRTMYHEYFHAMIGMMRSLGMFRGEKEMAALRRAFGKPRNELELFDEERAADMFADYVERRQARASRSKRAGFLARIYDFVKGLLVALRDGGFRYDAPIRRGGRDIPGREALFNLVLSGRMVSSLDASGPIERRLDDTRRAYVPGFENIPSNDIPANVRDLVPPPPVLEAAERRMDRMLGPLPSEEGDARSTLRSAADVRTDRAAMAEDARDLRLVLELRKPDEAVRRTIYRVIANRKGEPLTESDINGGDTAAAAPATSIETLSEELAFTMEEAGVPSEDSQFPGQTDVLAQTGNFIARAIANGLEALDPDEAAMVESRSDLAGYRFHSQLKDVVNDAVYDAVRRGLFQASDTLGRDLKAQDQRIKNHIYMRLLDVYDMLSLRLGYGGEKDPIQAARQHKVNLVERKKFVSTHDVAALVLTAGGLSYDTIAAQARARLRDAREAGRDDASLGRALDRLEFLLNAAAGKTRYKGDVIHGLVSGVLTHEADPATGVTPDVAADPAAAGTAADLNREVFQFSNPLFQDAYKTVLNTVYTLAAAKRMYRILGIDDSQLPVSTYVPGASTGLSSLQLEKVAPVDRRTGKPIPEPATIGETANALNISMSDLLDDRGAFNPFAEVGLFINNPGEWLKSTVRDTFRGKPLRALFTEHNDIEALAKRWGRIQNWWAMYLGENSREGTKLLRVIKDKGHHVFVDGHVEYDETGHERTGFDNYHWRSLGANAIWNSTVDVTLDREDKERIDFWLKSIYFRAMHDRCMYTGIDGIYITYGDIVNSWAGNREWTVDDFTPEKVEARYNDSRPGREISKVDMMLHQVWAGGQLPGHVVGGKIGLYDRLVKGIVETFNEIVRVYAATGGTIQDTNPRDANRMFLEGMARRGLMKYTVHRDGEPAHGVVVVPVDDIEDDWRGSATIAKLGDAGRDPDLLTGDHLASVTMDVYRESQRLVRKYPWMAEGDGRAFNTYGSMMPFFAGNGAFMYYANRIGRDAKKDVSQRLNQYEAAFLYTLNSADGETTDAQLRLVRDVFSFDSVGDKDAGDALREAIANGEYTEGTAKSRRTGLVISEDDLHHSHRVAEIIYRRLCEIAWAKDRHVHLVRKLGGKGSVARMLDFYEQIAGEYSGWGATGMNATQMYEVNGVLPANFQAFHALNVKLQELARTVQFRNTFVGFLFTTDDKGRPIAYAKPSLTSGGFAADGIPEEVWEYAARWWADVNGKSYEESMSGRVNAARLYDEIVTANASKMIGRGEEARHFRQLSGDDRAALTSVADFAVIDDDAGEDDVNARNAINGGEAYGYAKMLFNTHRVVGSKAQSLILDRISSWSKTLSVQYSMFFPWATRFESPTAAVGLGTMLLSNFSPDTARKLEGLAAKFDKAFHTHVSDTMNRNFLGWKDIVQMMDTDDPFLDQAYRVLNALGITLSDRLVNPMEENKAQMEADINRLADAARQYIGDDGAQFVKGLADGLLFRGSERAFTYALNATKIATAFQIAQVCQRKCREEGRAFNLVKEVRPYAAYLNAEIGGIDPMRYAWANPRFRRIMKWSMFSWEWTKGAWAAGGGEVIETALGGGHFTTPETRAFMLGRWLRMYGIVMFGIPLMMQILIKAISKLLGGYDGDDDDPWLTFDNETKHGTGAYNITPLLKTIGKSDLAIGLKTVPIIGRLVPAYSGKDKYNTSGGRKYYQHFGKQGWEWIRWFDDPVEQFLNKLSMPLQKLTQAVLGYDMASREYDLPFSKMSAAERWLNPTFDGAWWHLFKAFVPFSINGMLTYGDAGVLPVFGPVSMGTSYKAAIDDVSDALYRWATDDRANYAGGHFRVRGGSRKALAACVSDLLHDAKVNGMDPKGLLSEAAGLAAKPLYRDLFDLMPKGPQSQIDAREIARVARALNRLGLTQARAIASLKKKFGRHGLDWEKMKPEHRIRIRSILAEAMRNPFTADEASMRARTMRNLARRHLDPMLVVPRDEAFDRFGHPLIDREGNPIPASERRDY